MEAKSPSRGIRKIQTKLWIGYRDKPNEVLIKDPSLLSEEARKYASIPAVILKVNPDGPKNLFNSVYSFIREEKTQRKTNLISQHLKTVMLKIRLLNAILKSNKLKRWVTV